MRFVALSDSVKNEQGIRVVRVKPNIMISHESKPCAVCSTNTCCVDIFSDYHVCSEECYQNIYKIRRKN